MCMALIHDSVFANQPCTMQFLTLISATLATGVTASQSLHSLGTQRPTADQLTAWPKQLSKQWHSPARDPSRVCVVPSSVGDVTPALIAAAHECNNGGTVIFPAGANYTIATAADLTFLQSIDIAILGTVVFKDDLDYWQTHGYNYTFQGATLMWRFGGQDVNIYGLGEGGLNGKRHSSDYFSHEIDTNLEGRPGTNMVDQYDLQFGSAPAHPFWHRWSERFHNFWTEDAKSPELV
jgi:hypothetical protein